MFNMAEIFAPMQIMVVLVLALLLFGPKRLPELGKQIGTALRDLNKAKNDLMKHMTLDHEPDNDPVNYNYPQDQEHSGSYMNSVQNVDLSDYTIAGKEVKVQPADGAVQHYKSYEEIAAAASADYNLMAPPATASKESDKAAKPAEEKVAV